MYLMFGWPLKNAIKLFLVGDSICWLIDGRDYICVASPFDHFPIIFNGNEGNSNESEEQ